MCTRTVDNFLVSMVLIRLDCVPKARCMAQPYCKSNNKTNDLTALFHFVLSYIYTLYIYTIILSNFWTTNITSAIQTNFVRDKIYYKTIGWYRLTISLPTCVCTFKNRIYSQSRIFMSNIIRYRGIYSHAATQQGKCSLSVHFVCVCNSLHLSFHLYSRPI